MKIRHCNIWDLKSTHAICIPTNLGAGNGQLEEELIENLIESILGDVPGIELIKRDRG